MNPRRHTLTEEHIRKERRYGHPSFYVLAEEDWMKCILCNRYADVCHVSSKDHLKRVERQAAVAAPAFALPLPRPPPPPPPPPPPDAPPPMTYGRALADFNGSPFGSEYLTLKRGESLKLINCVDEDQGWAFGERENDAARGWFPADFFAERG